MSIRKIPIRLNPKDISQLITTLESYSETHLVGKLTHLVKEIKQKSKGFNTIAKIYETPCYVFDHKNLIDSIQNYQTAFNQILNCNHFYAVKLNHQSDILKTIFSHGFNADVSSARELFLAKEAGATKFLFSGPAKTYQELRLALDSKLDVTINIDNFCELIRLIKVCQELKIKNTPCGIRVNFTEFGCWDKFGINLSELVRFFTEANKHQEINLCGIQFHISWNQDGKIFDLAFRQLSEVFTNYDFKKFLTQIEFIDFGGGFRPYLSEGYYPEDTPIGTIQNSLAKISNQDLKFEHPYYILPSVAIADYATDIANAINQYIKPIKDFKFYSEPGRIIVNSCLHVLLKVIDIKSDNCIITDGGTNIVGFERFEFDYFPLINITNPSETEIECMVYGSLCMPQDYWGTRIYSGEIKENDLIVVPYQGALTYSNMNDFIKGKVSVYPLPYED